MECKYCNAPLPEDTTLCPYCGQDNAEAPEAEQAFDAVNEAAEETAAFAEDAAEEAKESFDSAAEEAEEAPEDAAEEAEEAPEGAAAEAEEALEEAAAEAEEAAEEAIVLSEAIPEADTVPEKPKKSAGKIVGIVAGCLVAVLLLAAAGYYGYYAYAHRAERSFPDNLKAATDVLLGRTPPLVGGDDINVKTVYTDETLLAGDKRLSTPVAQCGDVTLDNAQFQIYYWMQFFAFMNSYGSYASMYGLDTSQPMSEQPCMLQDGLNWEQLFVESGLDQFKEYAAVYTKAVSEGYTLRQEDQDNLDNMLTDLEGQAITNGYESADAFIQESFGPGVTLADYTKYANLYFLAACYERDMYEAIEYTDEDLKEWYQNSGYEEEYGIPLDDTLNVNVRHILIQPVADDEGNITDEAKAAAKAEAEEIYESWKQNPTEDYFAELAGTHSTDTGSANNGGLYEGVYPGQMVPTFNDWCFDPARKSGDTGIVETDYGYHIMYYVSQSDTQQWKVIASQEYPASRVTTAVQEIREQNPTTVCYKNILLCPHSLESLG